MLGAYRLCQLPHLAPRPYLDALPRLRLVAAVDESGRASSFAGDLRPGLQTAEEIRIDRFPGLDFQGVQGPVVFDQNIHLVAETSSWLKCGPWFKLDGVSPEKTSTQQKPCGGTAARSVRIPSRADRMIHRGSALRPARGSVVDYASGSQSQVVMMQTADYRHLDHFPTVRRLHRPRDWAVMGE